MLRSNLKKRIESLKSDFSIKKRHTLEVVWVLTGQIAVAVSGLITLKLLTNLLAVDTYGLFNLVTVAIILPSWLLFLPVSQSAIRMYSTYKEKEKLTNLLTTTKNLYFFLSVGVLIVGVAVIYFNLFAVSKISNIVIGLATVLLIAEVWRTLGIGFLSANRQRKEIAKINIGELWIKPIIIIFLVLTIGAKVPVALLSYILTAVVLISYIYYESEIKILSKKIFFIDPKLAKKLITYGLPFGIAAAFNWSQTYTDRYMISLLIDNYAVGAYVAGLQIVNFPFVSAFSLISILITPIVFQMAGSGNSRERLKKSISLIYMATIFFMFIGIFFLPVIYWYGKDIMILMTSKDYIVPNLVLVVLAGSALLKNAGQIIQIVLLVKNRTAAMLYIYVLTGLLSPLITYYLVKHYNILGASLASLSISMLYFIIVIVISKNVKIKILVT